MPIRLQRLVDTRYRLRAILRMNARQAKARHAAEEAAFRVQIVALVEAQKGVIGALARGLTAAQKDIEDLKQHMSDVESGVLPGSETVQ